MKKVLVLLVFLITSCGYQPIYVGIDENETIFKKIILIGDKKINRRIISTIALKEDINHKTENEITFFSEKKINETSKDSKGKVLSYKMTINLNTKIKRNEDIKERSYSKSFSYNNKDNKFDLNEYQNQIEKNIIDEIIRDLIIFIKL